jgi:hypothetical protein
LGQKVPHARASAQRASSGKPPTIENLESTKCTKTSYSSCIRVKLGPGFSSRSRATTPPLTIRINFINARWLGKSVKSLEMDAVLSHQRTANDGKIH